MRFYKFISAVTIVLFLTNCSSPESQSPSSVDGPPPVSNPEVPPLPLVEPPIPLVEPPLPVVEEEPIFVDPLLNVDLLSYHQDETRYLTPKQVRQLNLSTVAALYALPEPNPQRYVGRSRTPLITPDLAQQVIDSMSRHPVVAASAEYKYSQPQVMIGYCFGRATYSHLTLLRLGIAKESIRKAWLVGPMQAGSITWQFHVATVVRATNGKWMVVDDYLGQLTEIQEWTESFYPQNKKFKNLRLYITSPSKFSVSLSTYSRLQMGLDLSATEDWYRNYFRDMMNWFKNHSLEEVGLISRIEKPVGQVK